MCNRKLVYHFYLALLFLTMATHAFHLFASEEKGRQLITASKLSNSEAATTLIAAGAKLDLQDENGDTALAFAAYKGDNKSVEALIAAGAKLDLQSNYGDTALNWAAYSGKSKSVEALIKAGAKLDLQNKNGFTALSYAADKGYSKIVEVLKQAAKLREDYKGFHNAIKNGKLVDVIKYLEAGIDKEKDSDLFSSWGNKNTALIKAVKSDGPDRLEKIMVLLAAGANPNAENAKGETALKYAIEKNDFKTMAALLKKTNRNISNTMINGMPLIIWAVRYGHSEIIEALKENKNLESKSAELLKKEISQKEAEIKRKKDEEEAAVKTAAEEKQKKQEELKAIEAAAELIPKEKQQANRAEIVSLLMKAGYSGSKLKGVNLLSSDVHVNAIKALTKSGKNFNYEDVAKLTSENQVKILSSLVNRGYNIEKYLGGLHLLSSNAHVSAAEAIIKSAKDFKYEDLLTAKEKEAIVKFADIHPSQMAIAEALDANVEKARKEYLNNLEKFEKYTKEREDSSEDKECIQDTDTPGISRSISKCFLPLLKELMNNYKIKKNEFDYALKILREENKKLANTPPTLEELDLIKNATSRPLDENFSELDAIIDEGFRNGSFSEINAEMFAKNIDILIKEVKKSEDAYKHSLMIYKDLTSRCNMDMGCIDIKQFLAKDYAKMKATYNLFKERLASFKEDSQILKQIHQPSAPSALFITLEDFSKMTVGIYPNAKSILSAQPSQAVQPLQQAVQPVQPAATTFSTTALEKMQNSPYLHLHLQIEKNSQNVSAEDKKALPSKEIVPTTLGPTKMEPPVPAAVVDTPKKEETVMAAETAQSTPKTTKTKEKGLVIERITDPKMKEEAEHDKLVLELNSLPQAPASTSISQKEEAIAKTPRVLEIAK
ncbi:MAG: ankyrin repeat domain-containing protein [Oligoflexia bacterium]|nr:ankyrin repeat domain-containing protein [Oligoflexia bacterium]